MDQLWLSVIRSRFGVRKSAKSFNFLQRHSSSGTQTDFNQILMSARGGSVTLHRNEELKVDIIRIANISKKNALSGQMVLQLSEITSKLEKDRMQDKRAILISGDGDSFCAGADLSLVEKNLKQAGFSDKLSEIMYDSQQRLAKLPVPSIALIDGPAFGAGAELAIGCDLRLTTPSGQLSFVHGRMGLAPALGGATRLVQLVGSARALDLLVTGRNLQGKELVDWGLASGRVIGEDEA
uniref:Ethylmalonyl-CoA decarboxylase n=1 Tax=Strigamia maritima TaxID=126957 RepID=T1IHU9_STRMM